MSRRCTCTYFATRIQKGETLDFAYTVGNLRIFMPGCPEHEPPADEDDYYSFETITPPPKT